MKTLAFVLEIASVAVVGLCLLMVMGWGCYVMLWDWMDRKIQWHNKRNESIPLEENP